MSDGLDEAADLLSRDAFLMSEDPMVSVEARAGVRPVDDRTLAADGLVVRAVEGDGVLLWLLLD